MDEQDSTPSAVQATEFVLADELKKVWMQNPLKTVAVEIMGKTIFSCLSIIRPEIVDRLVPFNPADKHTIEVVELKASVPTEQLFMAELWCTENKDVAGLIAELVRVLDYGVVGDSVCLMPNMGQWDGPMGGALTTVTTFTLTFIRRAR